MALERQTQELEFFYGLNPMGYFFTLSLFEPIQQSVKTAVVALKFVLSGLSRNLFRYTEAIVQAPGNDRAISNQLLGHQQGTHLAPP